MAAPFKIVGIDHIVLRAVDPAALERFYLDVLGLTFEMRQGNLAQRRAGHALIDIVPADEAGPARGTSSTGGANLDHLCLRVEPFDAAAIAKHLAGQGVVCGGETLRYGAEGRGPSIYLKDRKATASNSRDRLLKRKLGQRRIADSSTTTPISPRSPETEITVEGKIVGEIGSLEVLAAQVRPGMRVAVPAHYNHVAWRRPPPSSPIAPRIFTSSVCQPPACRATS